MRTISDVFIRHGMHGLPLSMHLTVRGVLAGLMRGFSTPVPLSARLLALWASRVYSVALFHRGCDVDSQSGRLHGVCRGTDTGRPHQRDRLAQQRLSMSMHVLGRDRPDRPDSRCVCCAPASRRSPCVIAVGAERGNTALLFLDVPMLVHQVPSSTCSATPPARMACVPIRSHCSARHLHLLGSDASLRLGLQPQYWRSHCCRR